MKLAALSAVLAAGSVLGAEYPADDSLMKGVAPSVPAEFREGRATLDELEGWSRSLIQSDVELEPRNIDCDDADEILVEIVFARGTTGNRWFLAFDHGERGYRYVGTVQRILRTFAYPPECYVVQYGTAGAGVLSLSLYLAEGGKLSRIGEVALTAGDGGTEEDRTVFELLKNGEPSRDDLLRVFR